MTLWSQDNNFTAVLGFSLCIWMRMKCINICNITWNIIPTNLIKATLIIYNWICQYNLRLWNITVAFQNPEANYLFHLETTRATTKSWFFFEITKIFFYLALSVPMKFHAAKLLRHPLDKKLKISVAFQKLFCRNQKLTSA
jgi:hypothetical protein